MHRCTAGLAGAARAAVDVPVGVLPPLQHGDADHAECLRSLLVTHASASRRLLADPLQFRQGQLVGEYAAASTHHRASGAALWSVRPQADLGDTCQAAFLWATASLGRAENQQTERRGILRQVRALGANQQQVAHVQALRRHCHLGVAAEHSHGRRASSQARAFHSGCGCGCGC